MTRARFPGSRSPTMFDSRRTLRALDWCRVVLGTLWAFVASGLSGTAFAVPLADDPPVASSPTADARRLSEAFRAAARKIGPSVVSICLETEATRPRNGSGAVVSTTPQPKVRGETAEGGSGILIAPEGWILTNAHVIDGSGPIMVTLADGRRRLVQEVRRDILADLAVMRIEAEGLQVAEWGDSQHLEVGDWVLAVGQPFGLTGTVTAGIVSGTGRALKPDGPEDFLQTDAAINPGNSGGPLIDLEGRVVGIATAIKTRAGGAEGVGLAVPAHRARRVAHDLIAYGEVRRGWVGLNVSRADPDLAEALGYPGAWIVTALTRDGPAAQAGIRRGDLIVALDDQPLASLGPLQEQIEASLPPHPPLRLTLIRSLDPLTLNASESRSKVLPQRLTVELQPIPAPAAIRPILERDAPPPRLSDASSRIPNSSPRSAPTPGIPGIAARPAPTETRRSPTRFPTLGLRLAEPDSVEARGLIGHNSLDDPNTPLPGPVVVGVTPDGPADRGGLELGMVLTDLGNRRIHRLADLHAALLEHENGGDFVVRILKRGKPELRILVDVPGLSR